MKAKMTMLCLALVSGAAFAQHDHGGGQSAPMHSKKEKEEHLHRAPPVFQKQLADLFVASLPLKEALISSDSTAASASIQEVKNSLTKVDMALLKDEALLDWMSNLRIFNESMTLMSSSTSLKAQRKAFASFSDALYKSIKMFGAGGLTVYYAHCPMANNNTGAYWLSDSKQIRNPYMGETMLTCGKVKETLH